MTELALFVSTYVLVFFLGLNSLFVIGANYRGAFLTSVGISACQMVLLKLAPNANWTEIAAFMAGGPFGIVTSMYVYRRVLARRARQLPLHDSFWKEKGPL